MPTLEAEISIQEMKIVFLLTSQWVKVFSWRIWSLTTLHFLCHFPGTYTNAKDKLNKTKKISRDLMQYWLWWSMSAFLRMNLIRTHFQNFSNFTSCFLTISRAERPPLRLQLYKENPFQKHAWKIFFVDLLLVEIANDESWPQQKHMISILRNLHKVKRLF